MLRRAQLAFALVILLMLAPLVSAACGIQCLTATAMLSMHAAVSQQHCIRVSACCHSSGPAVCSAAQAPEATAALLSSNGGTAEAPAFAVVTAFLSQSPTIRAAYRIDSAPPGPLDSAIPIPLRI
jgi:hypothetical protein